MRYFLAAVLVVAFILSVVGYANCWSDARNDGQSVLSTLTDCG